MRSFRTYVINTQTILSVDAQHGRIYDLTAIGRQLEMTVIKSGSSGAVIIYRTLCAASVEHADDHEGNDEIPEEHDQARPEPSPFRFFFTAERLFHVFFSCGIGVADSSSGSAFSYVADGGFEESQLYYTTPQTNNQAENAGNVEENTRFPADFLPGACRTGGKD